MNNMVKLPEYSLNHDVICHIYSFNPLLPVIDNITNNYVNGIKNNKALSIQKMFKKCCIFKEMPILFLDEMYSSKYPRWLLIRLYIKFYPYEDLLDLPYYIVKKNYTLQEIKNSKFLSTIIFAFSRYSINKCLNKFKRYDIFKILRCFTYNQIINAGI
tara:strand:+ start:13822 stop:14295 length:474 start_codon:yes stop_codon:yes gene_type:complete